MLLIAVLWHMALSVSAQGLVGAPVDPRYLKTNEVGILSDYWFYYGRNIVLIATCMSFVLACLLIRHRARKVSGKQLAVELCVVLLIPMAIYFGGQYAVDNTGDLGSSRVGCVDSAQSKMPLVRCRNV